jgi:hypothetical protein
MRHGHEFLLLLLFVSLQHMIHIILYLVPPPQDCDFPKEYYHE